jgi:glycosyltransferase involved in cell wall biosynthesis
MISGTGNKNIMHENEGDVRKAAAAKPGEHIPRVSIGLAVYNGERYLEEALNAFLKQTFTDFELIISDNASTDRTEEICRSYAARDSRVHYYRSPRNMGVAHNYNRSVEMARAEYFRWATYDDLVAPTLLERCVDILDRYPDVVLAYPKTLNIDEHGKISGEYEDKFAFLDPKPHHRYRDLMIAVRNYLCNAEYGLMRRDALRKTAMEADYHSADRVLLSELVLHGKFYEIPERLYFHRLHPNMSLQEGMSLSQLAAWFNPNLAGKRTYPRLRRLVEFFKSVNRAPLSSFQRLYCYMQIVRFYLSVDKWQRLWRRIKSGSADKLVH